MGRFAGPQHRGAMKALRLERRAEAEKRQAAEQARDAEREARHQAEPERPLTKAEKEDLLAAVRAVAMVHLIDDLERLGCRPPVFMGSA